MKWLKYPFLAITPLLALGTLLGEYAGIGNFSWYFILIPVTIFIVSLILRFFHLAQNNYDFLTGAAIFTGFVLLGYFNLYFKTASQRPAITAGSTADITYFTATINTGPEVTILSKRYVITIDDIRLDEVWYKAHEPAILYIAKDHENRAIKFYAGDRLLVRGKPSYVEKNGNPYTFDYAQYLGRLGIYRQCFTTSGEYLYIGKNHRFSMMQLFRKGGDRLENILEQHIDNDRELNLARAMLLGRRDEITPEMENVYSVTGTAHILAVSGLHVGIIFLLLIRVFRFLKRSHTRWLYFAIQLTGIWAFAMMTGMSPPVQRAAIMFSFIIIANWTRRSSNIYNTLFAAAFFILLFSPNLLFSVSFQLSFLAVLGIVYLYKKVYSLIFIENRILDFFWQITALSIAVQIAIFPITIYYFHRFPLLFPITNLIAIPTATVVIAGGILLFIVSPVESIANMTGQLLEGWISIYHKTIAWLSGLPFASLDDLYLKTHEVFFILLCVFLLVRFIESKQFAVFKMLAAMLIVFAIIRVGDYYTMSRQQQLFIYKTKNRISTDLFCGRTCYTNSHTGKDEQYIFSPNRRYRRIDKVVSLDASPRAQVFGKNTVIVMNGKVFFLWQEPEIRADGPLKIPIDYLVVNRKTLDLLLEKGLKLKAGHLVLDGTIRGSAIDKALSFFKNDVKSIYAIHENGAFFIPK